MLKIFLFCLLLISLALLLLCVRMLLLKRGRFRSYHIGDSAAMRKRGITCVQSMDRQERASAQMRSQRLNQIKDKNKL